MNADIKGALEQIDRSWRAFVHNGKRMSKDEVRKVLKYGLQKGYTNTGQFSDQEVDAVLNIKRIICERCEKEAQELFMCERCETMICDSCQATYNQFTQIDYTCCKGCATSQSE